MSTRQTLRNYLSSVGIAGVSTISYASDIADGINADKLDEGDDLGVDPNTGKELIDFGRTGGVIPGYTGFITQRSGNTYTINNTTPTTQAESSNRGQNLAPAESQGATDVFVTTSDYPNVPGYFDESGHPITNLVDKTGNGSTTSGPDLIRSVLPDPKFSDVIRNQSDAVTSTFSVLKKYNKYNGGSESDDVQFVDTQGTDAPTDSLNIDERVDYNFQRGFGEYQIPDDSSAKKKSLDDMKDIAHSMILKAAGWDPTVNAASSIDPNLLFDSVSATAEGVYPVIDRILSPDQVRPRESYGAPVDGEQSFLANQGEAVTKIGADAKYTRVSTSVYTPEVTFSGTTLDENSQGILRAYQTAISIVSLAVIIEKTLSDKSNFFESELATLGLGPYYMGQYATIRDKGNAALRAITDACLINTGRFSYQSCVRAGLTLYFGIDANGELSTGTDEIPSSVRFASEIRTIASPNVNETIQSRMAQSYGFWQAVSRSCIRIIKLFQSALEIENPTMVANQVASLLTSKALRITNVFAQIGYSYLAAHLAQPTSTSQDQNFSRDQLKTAFSVDSIKSLPGTRVMKSRDTNGRSALSLAWRHSAVPSALLLPPSLIQASIEMDYAFEGPNPVKFLGSTTLQDKTYVSTRIKGRIPIEVVNNLESRLDAEYVPFYFHDLRTNEVIGLHAFLDSLTDNYGITYNTTQLHGRADTVKNYSNTKRSIGFSFWLISTSQDDFDEMWAKINKLVTLAYPQYTKGTMSVANNLQFTSLGGQTSYVFEQPFSQVVGGSPVVRLRIGDVIKSNYSRFNLARLFGGGNPEIGSTYAAEGIADAVKNLTNSGALLKSNYFNNLSLAPLLAAIASPAELIGMIPGAPDAAGNAAVEAGKSLLYDGLDLLLVNGFVNPLLLTLQSLQSPVPASAADNVPGLNNILGKIFLKPRFEPYKFVDPNNPERAVYLKITRPLVISVDKQLGSVGTTASGGSPIEVQITLPNVLPLKVDDSFVTPVNNKDILTSGGICNVTLDECLFDPDAYYSITLSALVALGAALTTPQGALVSAATAVLGSALASAGAPIDLSVAGDLFGSLHRQFTSGLRNPITAGIEGSMGRGLAGVITSMQFSWLDPSTLWETNWNSRAPMACKITVAFDPIHDISPGLDYYGANRAPVYNVGATRVIAGDPHPDNGRKSQVSFDRYGSYGLNLGSSKK